jgi:glutamate synthase domain-containing protein 1
MCPFNLSLILAIGLLSFYVLIRNMLEKKYSKMINANEGEVISTPIKISQKENHSYMKTSSEIMKKKRGMNQTQWTVFWRQFVINWTQLGECIRRTQPESEMTVSERLDNEARLATERWWDRADEVFHNVPHPNMDLYLKWWAVANATMTHEVAIYLMYGRCAPLAGFLITRGT